jgi:hypothetical protein
MQDILSDVVVVSFIPFPCPVLFRQLFCLDIGCIIRAVHVAHEDNMMSDVNQMKTYRCAGLLRCYHNLQDDELLQQPSIVRDMTEVK